MKEMWLLATVAQIQGEVYLDRPKLRSSFLCFNPAGPLTAPLC